MINESEHDSRLDQLLDNYRKTMDDHGWAITGVFPTRDDPGPSFAYTCGLTKWNHPELIIFGLPHHIGGTILNDIGDRISDGSAFGHGTELRDVLANDVPVRFVTVPPEATAAHLTLAGRFFDKPGFTVTALQVVWPAADGAWPWDSGSPESYRTAQPVFSTWEATR